MKNGAQLTLIFFAALGAFAQSITLTANPNPIQVSPASTVGVTRLAWNAPGHTNLSILVEGKIFGADLASSGTADIGNWVVDGTIFSLVDAGSTAPLATVTVRTSRDSNSTTSTSAANDLPRRASGGSDASNLMAIAQLRWYDVNQAAVFKTGPTYGMAFDGANLWVALYEAAAGSILKMRASDGSVVGTYSVGTLPNSVAVDGASVWVTNQGSNTVTKLKASDGTIIGTYSVGSTPSGIVFDGSNLWIANNGDGTVTKIRASDGSSLGAFPAGATPFRLAFDGKNIWVTNRSSNSVTKLRASDGISLGSFLVGSAPAGIAFDGTNMWIANSVGQTLTKLRASDGTVLGTYPAGGRPGGIVFDGVNIWTALFEGRVTKLRASDGVVIGTYPLNNAIATDVVFDGVNVWANDAGLGRLFKL